MRLEDDHRIYTTRDPHFWGPTFWDTLYISAFSLPFRLPPRQKKYLESFYKGLDVFLPCAVCKFHYSRNPRKSELNFITKLDVVNYINAIQNDVAQMYGKPLKSLDSVISDLNLRAQERECSPCKSYWTVVAMFTAVAVLCAIRGRFLH